MTKLVGNNVDKHRPLTPRDKGGGTRGWGGGFSFLNSLTWNLKVGRVTIKITSGFELVHSILLPYLYYYICVKRFSFTAPLDHISVPQTLPRDIKLIPSLHHA